MTNRQRQKYILEKGAERATQWIGSTNSLIFHTAVFVVAFLLPFFGIALNTILLVLTTVVSLEAIYLAIFIQMSVNKNTADIEDIAEDVEEIEKDVDEIQEDIDEIQEDIEEDEAEESAQEAREQKLLQNIEATLKKLSTEIESLKK